ncbi:MAG: zinc ribbon domain-containing protein [Candidatus Coatesbacteria bacterium]|nr:zinc ribbon domain-containing protein [Candidatus Coatesbacteria bacterium]
MPIYEYECHECKERFQVLQGMNEGSESVACPKCSAKAPKRLMSMFGSNMSSSSGASCGLTAST